MHNFFLDPIKNRHRCTREILMCDSSVTLKHLIEMRRRMRTSECILSVFEQVAGVTGVSRAICIFIHSRLC